MADWARFSPIEEKDIPDCAEVFVEVFGNEPWNEEWHIADARARLEEIYHTRGPYGVIAIEDGEAVGFAMGHTEQWRRGKKHFYIKEMCALTDRQRHGLGTGLMKTLCSDRAKRDVEAIYLLTAREGPAQALRTTRI